MDKDLIKRELVILLTLIIPTVIFGIYVSPLLDGMHYSVTSLIYSFDPHAFTSLPVQSMDPAGIVINAKQVA